MLLNIAQLFFGALMLVIGGEFVVRGASRIALAARLSPLFVGLTIVSFGTSAPELAVSLLTAFQGQTDITVGNVIGSNLFNLLLIIGVAALAVPLDVRTQVIRFDVPVMIGAAVLMYVLSIGGILGRIDGIVMLVVLTGYLLTSFWLGRRQFESDSPSANSQEKASSANETVTRRTSLPKNFVILAAGVGLLVLGCRWFVDASVAIAKVAGMSEAMIGLTIVSAGTSLPELVTSVMATLKGQRSIAIGNAVGSTTLNVLIVLGLTTLVAPAGVPVSDTLFQFDLPLMLVACVLIWPVMASGRRIARTEGLVLVSFYLMYMAYLIQNSVTDA